MQLHPETAHDVPQKEMPSTHVTTGPATNRSINEPCQTHQSSSRLCTSAPAAMRVYAMVLSRSFMLA